LVIEITVRIANVETVLAGYSPAAAITLLHVINDVVLWLAVKALPDLLRSRHVPHLAVVVSVQAPRQLAAGRRRQRREWNVQVDIAVLETDVLDVGNRVRTIRSRAAIGACGSCLAERGSRGE
jgi:hypothetical protein